MQQHRHHPPPLGVATVGLLGPHQSLDDRVHRLQVAGIGRHRQVDDPAGGRPVVVGVPEVVLHVAVAQVVGRQPVTLELGQYRLQRLA